MNLNEPGPQATFVNGLAAGNFMLQRCRSTGKFIYPPRASSSLSKAVDEWSWEPVSGLGTVYATTLISRRPEKGGDYNISIVELDEGPRMMTRVIGIAPENVIIGQRVRAVIRVPDFGLAAAQATPVVLFEPHFGNGASS